MRRVVPQEPEPGTATANTAATYTWSHASPMTKKATQITTKAAVVAIIRDQYHPYQRPSSPASWIRRESSTYARDLPDPPGTEPMHLPDRTPGPVNDRPARRLPRRDPAEGTSMPQIRKKTLASVTAPSSMEGVEEFITDRRESERGVGTQ